MPQCWAFRSLTIELNGSAVHAQFPDWPANEAVPIVELMQLPTRTSGWVSRGVNSSLDSVVLSTAGIRTNCACATCALAHVCWLHCSLALSDVACFCVLCSHAPSGRRPGADCDVCERRRDAGLHAAVDRPGDAGAASAASASATAFALTKAAAAAAGNGVTAAVGAASPSDGTATASAAATDAGPATDAAATGSAAAAAEPAATAKSVSAAAAAAAAQSAAESIAAAPSTTAAPEPTASEPSATTESAATKPAAATEPAAAVSISTGLCCSPTSLFRCTSGLHLKHHVTSTDCYIASN